MLQEKIYLENPQLPRMKMIVHSVESGYPRANALQLLYDRARE